MRTTDAIHACLSNKSFQGTEAHALFVADLKIVGSDIRTALFLQGVSGVPGLEAQVQPLEKHQKHPVEIVQLVYPTRQS